MKLFALPIALLVLGATAAPAAAAETPDPPRVVARLDGHDREFAELRREVAALKSQLEAQPARAASAPAPAALAAPAVTAYEAVSYDGGRSWVAAAAPARNAAINSATRSACAGGQCPTPRRR